VELKTTKFQANSIGTNSLIYIAVNLCNSLVKWGGGARGRKGVRRQGGGAERTYGGKGRKGGKEARGRGGNEKGGGEGGIRGCCWDIM